MFAAKTSVKTTEKYAKSNLNLIYGNLRNFKKMGWLWVASF